jgi:hypothetical protein
MERPGDQAEPPPLSDETANEEEEISDIFSPEGRLRPSGSADISLKNQLFPFSPPFLAKSRKERETLFMREFDDHTLFIRNKELRYTNSPVESLLTPEFAQNIVDMRQVF